MIKSLCKSLLILTAFLGFTATVAAQTSYRVEDLGTLPGDYESAPWGINSFGDVVGWSNGPAGLRAFVFTDERGLVELPALVKGARTLARDINDYGQVVGQSDFRAVRWNTLGSSDIVFPPQQLGTIDGESEAMAINNFGDIAGSFSNTRRGFYPHGFVYTDRSGMVDITPREPGSANDINDSGQVTGWHGHSAFLWQGGEMKDLGVLPGFATATAYGINQFAEVVGGSMNKSKTLQHAFRFSGSTGFEDLGGNGDENILRRINNHSQSVGMGLTADGHFQGLIHTDAEGTLGLNALITSRDEWFVKSATDINDEGVIVASAWNDRLKAWHAVRLVPTTSTAKPDFSCLSKCIRSSVIDLKAELFRKNTVNIAGTVTVVDENGIRLAGADVIATWLLPNGKTSNQLSVTDRTGKARFSVTNKRGTYKLTIDSLSMKGFTFDSVNSMMSKSITG